MKKSSIIRYTKLFYVILFLAACFRLYFYTRNLLNLHNHVGESVYFEYLLTQLPDNCSFQTVSGYSFRLFGCQTLSIGEVYAIHGTIASVTANYNNYLINLDIKDKSVISFPPSSFKFYFLGFARFVLKFTTFVSYRLDELLHTYLCGDAYYLVAGLTLGSKFVHFSTDFRVLISRLGLSHLVAVSGFHLSLLFLIFSGVFDRLIPRFFRVPSVILCLLWYALLVSSPLSLLRALFMLIFSLIGRQYLKKSINSIHFLFLVACLFVIVSPVTFFQVGVQLSFLATLGILLLARLTDETLGSDVAELVMSDDRFKQMTVNLFATCKSALFVTFAAQVATLPILINSFGTFAPWGLLSSLLFSGGVVFIVSFAVPLLSFGVILSVVFPSALVLISPFFVFLSDFVDVFLVFLHTFAKIFGFLLEVNFGFSLVMLFVYYLLIFALFSFVQKKSICCTKYVY